ncbi:hypothetical protein KC19_4G158800 [Ceratodon purpureus]|uniref:Uncharacterized protein n=1 Tax=Ceratodon purpureus TaxID=3225 RepID=A0A8T0IBN2_CERPU|nr:hypothetical protein KC19_4G158800 [Ceratodon purpureus]
MRNSTKSAILYRLHTKRSTMPSTSKSSGAIQKPSKQTPLLRNYSPRQRTIVHRKRQSERRPKQEKANQRYLSRQHRLVKIPNCNSTQTTHTTQVTATNCSAKPRHRARRPTLDSPNPPKPTLKNSITAFRSH